MGIVNRQEKDGGGQNFPRRVVDYLFTLIRYLLIGRGWSMVCKVNEEGGFLGSVTRKTRRGVEEVQEEA